jgi:hypothetical protein
MSTTLRDSLQAEAWSYATTYYASGATGPAMNSAARLAFAASGWLSDYCTATGDAGLSSYTTLYSTTNSTNPLWGSANIWEPAPPGGSNTGSGAATLPGQTASGSGGAVNSGIGAVTLPSRVASGTGGAINSGSGAATLPSQLASATGTNANSNSGTGSATLTGQTAAGVGGAVNSGSGAAQLAQWYAYGTDGSVSARKPSTRRTNVRLRRR